MDRLERIEVKVDKLHEKLDTVMERTVQTESVANRNKGIITMILTGIISTLVAGGAVVARYLLGSH